MAPGSTVMLIKVSIMVTKREQTFGARSSFMKQLRQHGCGLNNQFFSNQEVSSKPVGETEPNTVS